MWKTSLIKEKSLLVENYLDEGKILTCGKLLLSRKNICLCKSSFIKKKFWFVENFLEEGKIFACRKLPSSEKIFACGKLPQQRKNICLWKNKHQAYRHIDILDIQY